MKRFDILVIAALAATLSACRHDIDFDACGQIDAEQFPQRQPEELFPST